MEHGEPQIPDGVTPEELRMATEVAFLQVREYQGTRGPLDRGDRVMYRAPSGTVHMGPLVVLSSDAKTVLIDGFMSGNPTNIQLRVMRSEVVRVTDLKGLVHRILSESYPCPHCNPGKTPPKAN